MADTPPVGETVVVGDSKTTVTPSTPPVVTAADTGEAEKLRKELEHARLREAQLANQLKAKEEADAATKAKEMEEQNQFKELYEQERAKREAIETEAEAKERQAEIAKAKKDVLSEYSDEVKTLVDELGLDLADADEATVATFKEKVAKLDKGATVTGKVTSNNQPNPQGNSELSPDELKTALQGDKSFHDLVTARFPGIASMTNQRK
jgi:hypothetical protein